MRSSRNEGKGTAARDWIRLGRAAFSVVLCLLALGLWDALAPAAQSPRNLQLPGALAVVGEAPLWASVFYLGDSLFVLLALLLFAGLARVSHGPAWLTLSGLLAALGKALADWTENLTLAWPAWSLLLGEAASPLSEDWLRIIADIKRATAFLAALAFAPYHPAEQRSGQLVRLLLFVTALGTALGFVIPALTHANALFLFFAALALCWNARRHA
ncbi:MAG: hypothetical protein GDA47_03390 [Rhodospirillales bacterium]|nr:hypothetical protein [Rhodospirillales bacterium]